MQMNLLDRCCLVAGLLQWEWICLFAKIRQIVQSGIHALDKKILETQFLRHMDCLIVLVNGYHP